MGWYTELKVGQHSWSWRKTLPDEVPILFYGKHKLIDPDVELTIDSDVFVGYEATVNQVIQNLDNIGLSWEFFISLYESYRDGFIGYGITTFKAKEWFYSHSKNDYPNHKKEIVKAKNWIKRIENGNAKGDLESLVSLLKDGVKIPTALIDSDAIVPSILVARQDVDFDKPHVVEATTFGIFLEYAHQQLPDIAWLFEVRIILETLNRKSKVKLNLKEWVMEGGELDIVTGAMSSLALKAKTYYRTFDAILDGEMSHNVEYQRVKITDKWRKLKTIESTDPYKGTLLEDFIASLFHKSFGFEVLEKNLLVETQELDVVLKNASKNDFIKSLNSPFVLVECKNWTTPVGVSEARVFESKYRDFGNKVKLGFFVAINGVTKNFKTHINNLMRDSINLVIIDDKHIEQYLYSEYLDLNKWLEDLISRQFIQKR